MPLAAGVRSRYDCDSTSVPPAPVAPVGSDGLAGFAPRACTSPQRDANLIVAHAFRAALGYEGVAPCLLYRALVRDQVDTDLAALGAHRPVLVPVTPAGGHRL